MKRWLFSTRRALILLFPLMYGHMPLSAAVTGYDITVPDYVMKGDPDVHFDVSPLDNALPSTAQHNVIVTLPPGIISNPQALAPDGKNWSTIGQWDLITDAATVSGNVAINVRMAWSAFLIESNAYFYLEDPVRSFEITPVGTFPGTTGTPFQIRVSAKGGLNGQGGQIRGFKDDVTVTATVGDVVINGSSNMIRKDDFVDGVALVNIVLRGTNPTTRINRIKVQASRGYAGANIANGEVDISMNPGPYHHLVMLFDGEELDPGRVLNTFGKLKDPDNATAGIAYPNVSVYLVDQFNNPVLSAPQGGVPLTFLSSTHPGTLFPAPRTIDPGNNVAVFSDTFTFQVGNTYHDVRVEDSNISGRSSSSRVYVNSGNGNRIFVTVNFSTVTAGQAFNISARAVDNTASANTVKGFHNVAVDVILLSTAGVPIGGLGVLDTNPSLSGIQTQVTFSEGVFTGEIVLYPISPGARLKFVGGGYSGESGNFMIKHGDTRKLQVVMPGQSFTAGHYPGVSPFTPPTRQAGNVITATIFVVDEGWNPIPSALGGWSPGEVSISLQSTDSIPGYLDETAPRLTMPPTGEAGLAEGIRLRTAYPNGNAQLVAKMHGVLDGLSNPFTINPEVYSQLVFVTPGETLASGIQPSEQADGKKGTSTDQSVKAKVPVWVYLTDIYFNPIIDPPSGGWPQLRFSSIAPLGAVVDFQFTNPFQMTSGVFNREVVFETIEANTLRVVDNSASPKSIDQIINVTPGAVKYFVVTPNPASVTPDPISIQTAGVPFNLTFKAFDENHNVATNFVGDVYLELVEPGNNGLVPLYGGIISPSTVTFSNLGVNGGKVENVPITITYAGQATGLGDDSLQIRAYVSTPTMREGYSHEFNVKELSTWSDIVLTREGETLLPGLGPPYKTGTPSDVTAGDSFELTVTAVDLYGNRVEVPGQANITMATPDTYTDNPIPVDFNLGRGKRWMRIYTAGNSAIQASVVSNGFSDRSTGTILAGSYTSPTGRLLLLAPGETALPGREPPGKNTVNISSVVANTAMSFTLLACDAFYNRDTNYNSLPSFSLSSNDGAISRTGLTVTAGSGTVNGVFLIGNVGGPNPSTVRVTAVDSGNTGKSSVSDVPVLAGAYYRVTVPPVTTVGTLFPMTVDLIDPGNGDPVSGGEPINIRLEAITTSGEAAAVSLGESTATVTNGTAVIQQYYGSVEIIKIRVTDSFNRIAESGNIAVNPNGLIYKLTLPATTLTADDVFPVTVGLYDSVQQNVLIRNDVYQHSFNLHVSTTAPGPQAEGNYEPKAATLLNGQAVVSFNYTKAETIVIAASGTVAGFPAISGTTSVTIRPGAYVKLQVVSPGEEQRPGIYPSLTGKDSSGLVTQVARQGFDVRVYAVDRHWNVVNTLNTTTSPTVRLTATDNSLAGRPTEGFINGRALFTNIQLLKSETLTATDSSTPSLVPQGVYVPVVGPSYTVTLLTNPPYYTGSEINFRVSVSPWVETSDYKVAIQPLNAATYEPLDLSDLAVINPPTVGASNMVNIANPLNLKLNYKVARDVVFKITDESGFQGYSSTVSFVPSAVDYVLSFPAETRVGPPDSFSMVLTPRDRVTLTTAINFSTAVTITPVSPIGTPITGTLQKTTALIDRGAQTFQQAFSQSGVFYFTVSDGVNTTTSTTMNFLPGSLASIESSLSAVLEAGNTEVVTVTLLDAFRNPIPVTALTLSLADSSFGTLSPLTGITDEYGQLKSTFTTSSQKSGRGEFRAASGTTRLAQTFRLLGPPTTTLRVAGMGVEDASRYAVKPGDDLYFDLSVDTGLDPVGVTYSIDGGTSPVTLTTFTQLVSGIYSFGPIEFTTPGRHTIDYYGVTQSTTSLLLHAETARTSKTIYVSAVTTPEEGLVNYPNPFRAGQDLAFLEYHLSSEAGVTLTIYDLLGQKVWEQSYSQGESGGQSGLNRVSWDGKSSDGLVVGNGGYVAVLEASDGTKLKRKIAVKK